MSNEHFLSLSVGSFIIHLVPKTELFNTTTPETLLPGRSEGNIREKCSVAQQTQHILQLIPEPPLIHLLIKTTPLDKAAVWELGRRHYCL